MSNKIKNRTIIKDIKVLDKVASGTAHVKNAVVHTKDSAVKTQDSGYQSANDYATDKSSQGTQDVTKTVAERFRNPKQKAQQRPLLRPLNILQKPHRSPLRQQLLQPRPQSKSLSLW